ncbi:hypothetical protein PR202_gb24973 [Eleusine coracana subsp. coracana]|uniref:Uncharacterized protein n=1 Tax=Eleusine coracana subsp. coracana TaxID=191504 RepID=A0AAV5FNW7_ELECO|nr:hypothetical protein PR202_gb24973 [Eleusine coracana subsp. coracana]
MPACATNMGRYNYQHHLLFPCCLALQACPTRIYQLLYDERGKLPGGGGGGDSSESRARPWNLVASEASLLLIRVRPSEGDC